MANDMQGEVRFAALGREWTMKFGTRAMREVESETGRSIMFLGRDMNDPERGGFRLLSTLFLACLRHHHSTITADECDAIIDDIGNLETASDLISRAISRGKPASKGESGENPQMAAAE